jgi:hypothetical protein
VEARRISHRESRSLALTLLEATARIKDCSSSFVGKELDSMGKRSTVAFNLIIASHWTSKAAGMDKSQSNRTGFNLITDQSQKWNLSNYLLL